MDRVNEIYCNQTFRSHLAAIEEDEKYRRFCRHGMSHLMDVARLMYIYKLEDELGNRGSETVSREIIYAAALLHDIGRHCQYESGEPHHEAGARLADEILAECGFNESERETVISAIGTHREAGNEGYLAGLLYRADKASRLCFECEAREDCNWPEEKMNLKVGI